MSDIIEGEAEEILPPEQPASPPPVFPPTAQEPEPDPVVPVEPEQPAPTLAPVMPPEVEEGLTRASAEATTYGGQLRITRRVPETGQWFIVVERPGGGFTTLTWTGDGPVSQHGSVSESLTEAHNLVETAVTGQPPPEPGTPPAPVPVFDDDPAARLEWLKDRAKTKIDQEAEAARLKYITGGAGQAMEYLASEAEADQVLAAGPAFVIPDDPNLFPFLRAEATARGTTIYEAAQATAHAASLWRQVGAAIKALRLAGKAAVSVAVTEEEVWAASKITWPAPA